MTVNLDTLRVGHLDRLDLELAALDMQGELRAAREVVVAGRGLTAAIRSGGPWLTELAKLLVTIERYDQAVGGGV